MFAVQQEAQRKGMTLDEFIDTQRYNSMQLQQLLEILKPEALKRYGKYFLSSLGITQTYNATKQAQD